MMNYKDLEEVNKSLKTTDIKGKNYVEVNHRVLAFRKLYPEGQINTEILKLDEGVVIIKATVLDENLKILSTGIAYEKENSTFINKTSYIENCETSAVGRALGFLGIGIDTSIASAEEVTNAIENQNGDEVITNTQIQAIRMSLTNNNLSADDEEKVVKTLGYKKLEEVKKKDFAELVDRFKKLTETK